jgi:hypothetical protein
MRSEFLFDIPTMLSFALIHTKEKTGHDIRGFSLLVAQSGMALCRREMTNTSQRPGVILTSPVLGEFITDYLILFSERNLRS